MHVEHAADTDPLGLIGTLVDDRYQVEAIAGMGGTAVVYRARHVRWNRYVALKVVRALQDVSADLRRTLFTHLEQEAGVLASLSERTSAIVQARDVGYLKTPSGVTAPYLVLEWLEGETLDDMLERERAQGIPPRGLARSMRLLEPIAEALDLAHRAGVAHRDVKPANIFVIGGRDSQSSGSSGASTSAVDSDLVLKVLDFGIAKVVADVFALDGGFSKTLRDVTAFTPGYAAPEQFSREIGATGPWTDVFGLALLLSELTTGRPALLGEDLAELAAASSSLDRPSLIHAPDVITEAVATVFARAVAIHPTERFQTAGGFWRALRDAIGLPQHQMSMTPAPHVTTTTSMESGSRWSTPGTIAGAAPLFNAHTTAQSFHANIPGFTIAPPPPPQPSPLASLALRTPAPTIPPSIQSGAAPASSGGGTRWPILGAVSLLVLGLIGVTGAASLRLFGGDRATSAAAGASASASSPAASHAALPPAPPSCPPNMVMIDGGKFFMGSDDKDALDFEKPSHKVTLAAFCMDRTEVTMAAYKACSDQGECKRAAIENEWKDITTADRKTYDPLCNAREPIERGQHPVNCVDHKLASDYCKAKGGRLPTEAEWEFAARGPDGRTYPWGDDLPSAKLLNACGSECMKWARAHNAASGAAALEPMYKDDDGYAATAPVGSFPLGASRFGIQDVVGNVWEWVDDWYADYDAASGASEEQKDPIGPASGTERVIRGGAWNGGYPSWVRPTFRYKNDPATRSHGVGFRCASTPR